MHSGPKRLLTPRIAACARTNGNVTPKLSDSIVAFRQVPHRLAGHPSGSAAPTLVPSSACVGVNLYGLLELTAVQPL